MNWKRLSFSFDRVFSMFCLKLLSSISHLEGGPETPPRAPLVSPKDTGKAYCSEVRV